MASNNDKVKSDEVELQPEEKLCAFEKLVNSLMQDASEVLGQIELEVGGAEVEELIHRLDHYLDYTQRLFYQTKTQCLIRSCTIDPSNLPCTVIICPFVNRFSSSSCPLSNMHRTLCNKSLPSLRII